MAILTDNENVVEVRIIRNEDGTQFTEYVKIGDREKDGATRCDLYIISEPGRIYTIVVTLKKGYLFGKCNQVRVYLWFGGIAHAVGRATFRRPDYVMNLDDILKEDMTLSMEHTSIEPKNFVLGISGAHFHCRDIQPGKCF